VSVSAKHIALQNRSLVWLLNKTTQRGIRGGLEIPLNVGYVADAACVCDFKRSIEERYTGKRTDHNPTRHNLDIKSGTHRSNALVFEIKVDLPDLLATFTKGGGGNRSFPVGNLHWLVIPRGRYELWGNSLRGVPDFWGILEESGKGLAERRKPRYMGMGDASYHKFCASILWYQ